MMFVVVFVGLFCMMFMGEQPIYLGTLGWIAMVAAVAQFLHSAPPGKEASEPVD